MSEIQGWCSKCDKHDLALIEVEGRERLGVYNTDRYMVVYHLSEATGKPCKGSHKPPLQVVEA